MRFSEPPVTPPADSDPQDFAALPKNAALQASVLLVEDDSSLRILTQRVLKRAGYRVAAVGDAAEALALVESKDCEPALLITDLELPDQNGRELARELQQLLPTLTVLYISGHADEQQLRRQLDLPDPRTLTKPFTSEALLAEVRRALSRA